MNQKPTPNSIEFMDFDALAGTGEGSETITTDTASSGGRFRGCLTADRWQQVVALGLALATVLAVVSTLLPSLLARFAFNSETDGSSGDAYDSTLSISNEGTARLDGWGRYTLSYGGSFGEPDFHAQLPRFVVLLLFAALLTLIAAALSLLTGRAWQRRGALLAVAATGVSIGAVGSSWLDSRSIVAELSSTQQLSVTQSGLWVQVAALSLTAAAATMAWLRTGQSPTNATDPVVAPDQETDPA